MRWIRKDSYYWLSECGRYTVSRTVLPNGERFSAWRLESGNMPGTLIGIEDDKRAAARLCVEDKQR